jgi:hypothetical protein
MDYESTYQGARGWIMGCTETTEGAPKVAELKGY